MQLLPRFVMIVASTLFVKAVRKRNRVRKKNIIQDVFQKLALVASLCKTSNKITENYLVQYQDLISP